MQVLRAPNLNWSTGLHFEQGFHLADAYYVRPNVVMPPVVTRDLEK